MIGSSVLVPALCSGTDLTFFPHAETIPFPPRVCVVCAVGAWVGTSCEALVADVIRDRAGGLMGMGAGESIGGGGGGTDG